MNRWRRIDRDLWQCFLWDVCWHNGRWHFCTPYGQTIKEFDDARAAMQWADWYTTQPA
jgi:hypothetical protein